MGEGWEKECFFFFFPYLETGGRFWAGHPACRRDEAEWDATHGRFPKCNCGREEAVRLVGQVQRQVSAALDPGARQQARPGLWRPLAVRVLLLLLLLLLPTPSGSVKSTTTKQALTSPLRQQPSDDDLAHRKTTNIYFPFVYIARHPRAPLNGPGNAQRRGGGIDGSDSSNHHHLRLKRAGRL